MSAGNHELYAQLLSVFIEKEMPKEQEGHKEEILLHLEFICNKEGADDVIVEYCVYDDDYAVLKLDGVEKFQMMKKMKKLAVIILAVIVAGALMACGGSGDTKQRGNGILI